MKTARVASDFPAPFLLRGCETSPEGLSGTTTMLESMQAKPRGPLGLGLWDRVYGPGNAFEQVTRLREHVEGLPPSPLGGARGIVDTAKRHVERLKAKIHKPRRRS